MMITSLNNLYNRDNYKNKTEQKANKQKQNNLFFIHNLVEDITVLS